VANKGLCVLRRQMTRSLADNTQTVQGTGWVGTWRAGLSPGVVRGSALSRKEGVCCSEMELGSTVEADKKV
jgi:hypothetical protein